MGTGSKGKSIPLANCIQGTTFLDELFMEVFVNLFVSALVLQSIDGTSAEMEIHRDRERGSASGTMPIQHSGADEESQEE